jgi:hypothetical protein
VIAQQEGGKQKVDHNGEGGVSVTAG